MFDDREFGTQFTLHYDPIANICNKSLKFNGEIDLGEFSGAFVCQNFNWEEMRSIVDEKVKEALDKSLSDRAFSCY